MAARSAHTIFSLHWPSVCLTRGFEHQTRDEGSDWYRSCCASPLPPTNSSSPHEMRPQVSLLFSREAVADEMTLSMRACEYCVRAVDGRTAMVLSWVGEPSDVISAQEYIAAIHISASSWKNVVCRRACSICPITPMCKSASMIGRLTCYSPPAIPWKILLLLSTFPTQHVIDQSLV